MTQTDPWAAAQAQTTPASPAAQNGGSGLADSFPGSGLGGDSLFGGGKSVPSLFNRTHPKGTERSGVIVDIKDVHSRFHPREHGGGLKYWEDSTQGKTGERPVPDATSPVTGKENRPVMDTHLILDTEYRLTAQECETLGRDTSQISEDEGRRVYVAGKETKEAIKRDAPALGLRGPQDLIGKRITVTRLGVPGEKQAWAEKFTTA